MRVTTSDLNDLDTLQEFDEPRRRLVGITFDVGRKVAHRLKAKLTAGTGAPRVYISLNVDCDGMSIAPCNLIDTLVPKPEDFEWIRLERITLTVLGHSRDDLR